VCDGPVRMDRRWVVQEIIRTRVNIADDTRRYVGGGRGSCEIVI
jgi:hypothetical protein